MATYVPGGAGFMDNSLVDPLENSGQLVHVLFVFHIIQILQMSFVILILEMFILNSTANSFLHALGYRNSCAA